MYGHQSLREVRTEKLATIDSLSSGRVKTSGGSGSCIRDVTADMRAELQHDIAEIERILTAAGKPFDA